MITEYGIEAKSNSEIISIKGHIVDEFGKNVEFASVYVDSIYAVSDKEGNFSLVVPNGMKQELVISHISYQTNKIPYDVYSKKTSLQLTLHAQFV